MLSGCNFQTLKCWEHIPDPKLWFIFPVDRKIGSKSSSHLSNQNKPRVFIYYIHWVYSYYGFIVEFLVISSIVTAGQVVFENYV